MTRSLVHRTLLISIAAGFLAACSTARPYDYRDYQAAPAVDPFMVDQRTGGPAGVMTVKGDLVTFESECGIVGVRRLTGPPVVFEEPATTHRGRIESYDRKSTLASCDGGVGDEVALVAVDIGISPEFGQAAFTNASVRPLDGDRVPMRWFANIHIPDDRSALPLDHPGRRPGGRW